MRREATPAGDTTTQSVGGELDLEGRQALGNVLQRLTGRRAPFRVGRYELGEKLGAGGCGAVYAADDPKLDRRVAVKVVLPSASPRAHDDEHGEARLVREAQALAKLRHPSVVEIFDVGTDAVGTDVRGRPRRGVYIVMELVDGPDLRKWLHDTRPDRARILDVFAQAADGLAAAHRVGVVHRDFKPSNVMLTRRGRVKVLDFGLARDDVEPFPETSPTGRFAAVPRADESLTRTGVVMGTPRYMAPEQHAAEPADAKSDQYALAVSLWEALLDAPAFDADSLQGLYEAKCIGAPPRPAAMPRPLYAVIARAMDPDPARRFPDMSTFAALLRAPARRNRRLLAGLGGGLGLGAAAFAVAAAGAGASLPPPCDTESPRPAWERDARTSIQALATELEGDDWGIVPRIEPRIEAFMTGWVATKDRLCDDAAPAVPGDRGERARCLQRGRTRFEGALAALKGDPGAVRSRRKIFSLEAPARCETDPPELLYRRTPEEDAELDALVEASVEIATLGRELDAATDEAFARGIEQAKALGDVWTSTQLLTARASGAARRGEAAVAVRFAFEASWLAEASGDRLLAAELLPSVIGQLYDHAATRTEFERIAAHGEELLAAAGDPLGPRVGFDAMRSLFLLRFGELDEGIAAARAAVDRAGDPPAAGTARYVGVALLSVARHEFDELELDAAWRTTDRMLALRPADALWVRGLAGPAHGMRAAIARERGDDQTAIVEALGQIEANSAALDPEHPATMVGVALYGSLLVDRGAPDLGIALITAARSHLLDDAGGAAHQVANVEHFLLEAEIDHGDPKRAVGYAVEVLERATVELGADSPELAWPWLTLAEARYAADDARGAAAALDEVFARMDPADTYISTDATYLRAELHLEAERWAAARDDYLQTVAGLPPHETSTWANGFRGEAWRGVAYALRGLGDDDGARIVAGLADEALARGSVWHQLDREDLEQLLAPQPKRRPRTRANAAR